MIMRFFLIFLFFFLLFFPYRLFAYEYSCGCMTVSYSLDMSDGCEVFATSAAAIEAANDPADNPYLRASWGTSAAFLKGNIYLEDGDYSVDFFAYCRCDEKEAELSGQCDYGDIVWSDAEACEGECQCDVIEDCQDKAVCDCYDKGGVVWGDDAGCSYHCKYDSCYEKAASECGDSEFVIWNDVEICDYDCKTNCEDEYYAARTRCDEPRLVDSNTCEYTCNCEAERSSAEDTCTEGYFIDPESCEWDCKSCFDKANDCVSKCGGSDNISNLDCVDSKGPGVEDPLIITSYDCDCTVPPIEDIEPPAGNPVVDPDPSDPSGNPDDGDDPADPGPDGELGTADDGEPGTADDNNNGWLKEMEGDLDRIAENTDESNGWLEAIKHNTDTQITNDKKYFLDENERSVFKNRDGKSYLEIIAGKDFSADVTVESPDTIETTGSGIEPDDNVYSSTFTEEEGFTPVPEDVFSQGLSDYIATGIPLIGWLEGSTFNLTSSSPVLTFNFFGDSINVDFSTYQPIVDIVGNMLFYLTIISGFILVIARIKG